MNSPHNTPLDISKILEFVFHVPPDSLSDADSSETVHGWDSFQTLIMFQELEKQADVSFTLEDLARVRTIGDIKKLLEKYNVPFL